VFWYIGMVPDFGTLRDRAKSPIAKYLYGLVALGWRGSTRHWIRYESASLLLAGLSTPLVLSVHTTISFDFAVAAMAGWHTTIFPPYFVAGAVFSGFAMVETVLLIARAVFKLQRVVLMRHLELMNKFLLLTSLLVGYSYSMEFFTAWYSGNKYEMAHFLVNRPTGPYWWAWFWMVTCNCVVPQIYWSKKMRTSIPAMFIASILINIGMLFERFVIIVSSLNRDFLPSSWGLFRPTIIDVGTFMGTIGVFFTLFLLFMRWLPMVAMAEVKGTMMQADAHRAPDADKKHAPAHDKHEQPAAGGLVPEGAE
ncbi:MAG: NrfD/PsrC family molybdoenzyme membrane anchor subunit, partial [Polyangiaceae bacterium]